MNYICPQCGEELSQDPYYCNPCNTHYPSLAGVPWLTPNPQLILWEWRLRFKHYLQLLSTGIEANKNSLKIANLLPLTEQRLRKLLQAKVEHRRQIEDLLAPLNIDNSGSLAISQGFKVTLPPTQTLTGYYNNIHRDWSWESDENNICMGCINEIIADRHDLGTVVVLGAGAGRLAYDLHQTGLPTRTIASDFNPLMVLTFQRIVRQKSLKLFEFPLAPMNLDSFAVLRKCLAPAPPKKNLEILGTNALAMPLARESVNTVFTPWLIDILDCDLQTLIAEISRLLPIDGLWINFGSVVFNKPQIAHNYSTEEVFEICTRSGFKILRSSKTTIPYMKSPASNHSRMETVVTFVAQKIAEIQPLASQGKKADPTPEWINNNNLPIPKHPIFESTLLMHTIYLNALTLIDGTRSIQDLANIFATQHFIDPVESLELFKKFLLRIYLEGQTGASL